MKVILVIKLAKDEDFVHRSVLELGRVPVQGEFIGRANSSELYLVRSVWHYAVDGDEPVAEVFAVEADKRTVLNAAAGKPLMERKEEQWGEDFDSAMASLDPASQGNAIKSILYRLLRDVKEAQRTGKWAANEVEKLKQQG